MAIPSEESGYWYERLSEANEIFSNALEFDTRREWNRTIRRFRKLKNMSETNCGRVMAARRGFEGCLYAERHKEAGKLLSEVEEIVKNGNCTARIKEWLNEMRDLAKSANIM